MSVTTSVRPIARSVTICAQCRRISSRNKIKRSAAAAYDRPSHGAQEIDASNASSFLNNDLAKDVPRWARTPQQMRAPIRIRPVTENSQYQVNEDPQVLSAAYKRLLGLGGENMLSESVMWLAVTHKSFDHGARGFNERLGFLGKRIVELQLSLALLNKPRNRKLPGPDAVDQYGRTPFIHQALRNVENINAHVREKVLEKGKLAQIAQQYGLGEVIRWKPRIVNNLQTSGIEHVLAQTLYAIVGAVALQKGGEAANQLVRRKILNPLGFTE